VTVAEPFVRRPVATTLLTLALALGGLLGFRLLPVAPLPQVDFPTIQVGASLPGASPETMASAVAMPLERQFGRIAGVTEMTSSSQLGSTSIVLQFDLSRDTDGAARDVQAAINAARSQLPSTLPNNPMYRKVNPADAPILILALTSDTVDASRLYEACSSVLQQKLSQVEGVGQAFCGGSSLPGVRVELNPSALDRYGIGLDEVRTVLATANANRPKGVVEDATRSWTVSASDQLQRADGYRELIVAWRNGAGVRLSDVADVEDGVEDVRNAGMVNGRPSVLVILFRQPGANIIETVDRVRALLPQLEASIPAAMELTSVLDRSDAIRASIHEVELSLVISTALVILVVFLFLRDLRATAIPSVVVPLSLVGTFGVMYLCGYSLDNLSLMALTVSTGFVVDDAIVVIENVARHLERGMKPFEATLLGVREIGFTVVSMSVSLVAVFIPILLMGGIVGRLFREFAVVLSIAVLISLVVSLTTTPMMCARMLEPAGARRHGRLYRASERAFAALLRGYERTLRIALRWAPATLAIAILTVCLNVHLYRVVPKGFFPPQDTGRLAGTVQADQATSFQSLRGKLAQFADVLQADPAVGTVIGMSGGQQGTTNTGRIFAVLKPLAERGGLSADQVLTRLRPKLAAVPGAMLVMQPVQDIRIGGRVGGTLYQYTLQGDDLAELLQWAPRVLHALQGLPELVDVNTDQQTRGLESSIVIDRDTAARLGITTQQLDETLYDAFGQRQVSTIYTALNQHHVVMEVAPRYWQDPATLRDLHVRSVDGASVPLRAFAHLGPGNASLAVTHQGQFPAVTIYFNLAPDVALGDAVDAIERTVRELRVPASIHADFAGAAQAFQSSLADEPLLVLAALVTVYIVLGMLYESYVHPLTILSTLPSAGVGAIAALMLCGMSLDVIGLIGIILLIGIVKKNAIMMVDFAVDAERTHGASPEEAITEACLLRFRPILMTTMAALLGGLPLALGTGMGSELRRPLGVTIVGGLLVSQVLTLYTTPVVYLYLDRLRHRVARWRGRPAAAPLAS
jgi:multidrug efflux pump